MDAQIFSFIHGFTGRYQLLDWIGVFFARSAIYLIIAAAVILIFLEKRWRYRLYRGLLLILSFLIARGLVVEVIRFFYHRPRPYLALGFKPIISPEISYSFPSGHAAVAAAVAAAIFFTNRRWSWWAAGAALLVGLGRVYVGVHWPSDIVAGLAIGVLSAYAAKKILPAPDNLNR